MKTKRRDNCTFQDLYTMRERCVHLPSTWVPRSDSTGRRQKRASRSVKSCSGLQATFVPEHTKWSRATLPVLLTGLAISLAKNGRLDIDWPVGTDALSEMPYAGGLQTRPNLGSIEGNAIALSQSGPRWSTVKVERETTGIVRDQANTPGSRLGPPVPPAAQGPREPPLLLLTLLRRQ